jgi:polysaccharide biosynthesis transport protein
MLNANVKDPALNSFGEDDSDQQLQKIQRWFAAARRQKRVLGIAVGIGFGLGILYQLMATPRYTAAISILIDSQRDQERNSSVSIADQTYDTGAIDSQVEVLTSDNVAALVVKSLSLDTDPEFMARGFLSTAISSIVHFIDITRFFTSEQPNPEAIANARRRAAMSIVQASTTVKRVNRTYVLTLSVRTTSADLSARIANAYADAYFTDQMDSRFQVTRRASGWLQERIAELKENSIKADLAVQKYKADHNIVTTVQTSSGPNYLPEQQISELTSQLSTAHSETLKAQARVDQIQRILQSGRMDGSVADTLGDPVINDLRSKYLKASKTASELKARVGAGHYQVMAAQNEMALYERGIFEELSRIAETYKSDVQVANAREKSLSDSMNQLIGNQASSNSSMVQLRELERESEAYKTLYASFLQRYQDALQKQSFPSSEARVITPAYRPDQSSWPKMMIVLPSGAMLGLLIGAGVAVYREMRERGFREGRQVREELGLNLIGMLPIVANNPLPVRSAASNIVQPTEEALLHVIDNPLSMFSEVFRSAKVELDLATPRGDGAKVVGVVSALPGEGKTTVAKNFASLLATQGARTLLIDGDTRNPNLTRRLADRATVGLIEVLRRDCDVSDALYTETASGLSMLPTVLRKKIVQSADFWASQKMDSLMNALRSKYDYIVIDLPPAVPVSDVRAAIHLLDAVLLVAKWGATPRDVVRGIFETDGQLYDKCFGVVLNDVDFELLREYDGYGSGYGYGYGAEGYQNYVKSAH